MKIVIAGGSGYLGRLLINFYKDKNEVFVLTRKVTKKAFSEAITQVEWDGKTVGDWKNCLENADALINLAGKNISTRFTEENKKEILSSRIESTEALGKAIEQCQNPPKMWLNASSIAIYDESRREEKNEFSELDGSDFLSTVCRQWEMAFHRYAEHCNTKKAVFRLSLVLGNSEGSALHTLKKIVKLGCGGKAGSGMQMVSWIGELDFVKAIHYIVKKQLTGDFNFANGSAITNARLMKLLRKKYNRNFGLSAPVALVKIGTAIIGASPQLVLRSQNVVPKRLWDAGFDFKQESILDL